MKTPRISKHDPEKAASWLEARRAARAGAATVVHDAEEILRRCGASDADLAERRRGVEATIARTRRLNHDGR